MMLSHLLIFTSSRPAALLAAVAIPSALSAALPPLQIPQRTAPLVFDHVTVVDVQSGKLLPDQRVIVVGARISAAGTRRSVAVPPGAHVVDAQGKYLIPGLWDMHTHSDRLVDLFYPLFIANGVTGIRDATSEVPLDTLVRWRLEILAGTRVGPPRQILSGQAIDEKRPCTRTKGIHTCVTDPADARHLVDSLKAAGADMIKPYELSDSMYFVIAAEARRVGIRLGGHTMVSAIAASDSGASIIDHSTVNQELRDRCLYDAASVEQCRPVAARLARNGTWWVPTWVMPPRMAGTARSHAIYRRFDEFLREFWTDSGPQGNLQDYLRLPDGAPEAPAASSSASILDSLGYMYVVRQAGLPVMAGTDAAGLNGEIAREVPAGFTLLAELATYVAEGLTPLQALQSATLNPAKMLHGTDSLGTVATGKLADLVLLDGDPLADITNLAAIRAVVANGRYFDRAALDALLAAAKRTVVP